MSQPHLAHRYRLLRSLGQGGMGQVWLAEDTVQGDEVALKVLTEQLATDQASILQVKQEFRLMTLLHHLNCCEVFDYGFQGDGKPFFTMEVVPGDGLDGLVPLTPDRFRPLCIQLLQALGYVHQRGYVHCDIKSENVRVKPDGTLKLMDFGLMLNAGSTGLPIRGTLGYLPPEVIKRGAIDQRSDLYAFGCLAFEALTGQLPFPRAKAMEVIKAHLNDAPPLPGRLLDATGCDWAPILAKLLAKDPLDRFQAAEDVLDALGVEVEGGLGGSLLAAQLVGREVELGVLQACLDQVKRREACVPVALHGPEGSGKTRVLAEIRVRAQLDHVPFGLGACHRHTTTPLGPVIMALRSLLPSARTVAPALLDELAPVLMTILPEIGANPSSELDSPDKEKARLFGAMERLLHGLAEVDGLVLAFEDWQWADTLSQEFLAYLRRNAGEAPLFLLMSLRDKTPQAPWSQDVRWLSLGGLDGQASAKLLCSMLGTETVPAAFLAKMHALTEGNPEMLAGAISHLVQTLVLSRVDRKWQFTTDWDERLLPMNQLGLFHRRLSFLGEEARSLAQVAAVIGKPTDLAELLAVSGRLEEPLFGALEQLLEHQIIRRDEGGAYRLVHEVLIPHLYEGVAPAERQRLHGLMLLHLEKGLAGRPLHELPLELVTLLAHHAFGADDQPRAIRYALEAGKKSTMLYANEEASRMLNAGLMAVRKAADPALAPVLVDYMRFLADVYRVTGRYDEALSLYHEAIALAEDAGDALTLGRVLTSLAKLHMVRDQLEDALIQARRALAASTDQGQGAMTLRAMLTEVRALFFLGRTAEAMGRADETLASARALDQKVQMAQALALRGYLEVSSPTPDAQRSVALLQEASALFIELGDRLGLYNATNLLGNTLMAMGDYAEAWQAFEGTRQLAFELGAKDDETFAWLNLAQAALELGRLTASRDAANRAYELAATLQSRLTMGMALALKTSAQALLGETSGVTGQFDEALGLARTIKSKYLEMLVRQQQVETLLYLGACGEALDAVGAWRAIKLETGNTEGDARVSALEGAALYGLVRDAEASEVTGRALAEAEAAHAKGDRARAFVTLARLSARAGRQDEARRYVAAGLALAGQIGAQLIAADLQGVSGELALATGQAAEPHFKPMLALAKEAGAPLYEAIAQFGLAASSPYSPQAAALAMGARTQLELAMRGLDTAGRATFLIYPERQRASEGNHIAFSLPTAQRERRAPTGPLGFGMGGL